MVGYLGGSSGGMGGMSKTHRVTSRQDVQPRCLSWGVSHHCWAERPELELTEVTRLLPVTKLGLRDALLVLKGTLQDPICPSSFPAAYALPLTCVL